MSVTIKKAMKKIIHAHVMDEAEEAPANERQELDVRIKATRIECVPIGQLKPNPRNAKKHPPRQITLLVENYEQFGVTQPIVVDEDDTIICGHARFEAAQKAKLNHLPAVRLSGLTTAQKRALAIADNKLAELGEWDIEILSQELSFLFDPDTELTFDPRVIGFETVELDQILGDRHEDNRADPADEIVTLDSQEPAVTRPGDVWICDQHRLACGDATNKDLYSAVMETDLAEIVFTDPPYNVPNAGHVTGRDGVREFAMAHGEMSPSQFTDFLSAASQTFGPGRRTARSDTFAWTGDTSSNFKLRLIESSGNPRTSLCGSSPTRMGSLRRSQHELIYVYAAPGRPINKVRAGRQRPLPHQRVEVSGVQQLRPRP